MLITGILLILFFVLSIKRANLAFSIILGLLPAYLFRFQILNIPTTLLEMMVGVFLLSVLITKWGSPEWGKIKNLKEVNVLVGIMLIAVTLGTIISPEPIKALGQAKAFFIEPILLFYAGVLLFKNTGELKLPLQFLFASAVVISFFGIFQYWTNLLLPLRFWGYGEEIKRITSVFEYPNALALYLAPLFLFFLTLFVKGYDFGKKYLLAPGLLLMFIAVVLTFSRGALLGIGAGIIILSLRLSGVSLKRWGTLVLMTMLVLSPLLITRFQSTFNDASSSERLKLYKTAGEKLIENPILGNGLYGFRSTLQNSEYNGEILNYPHNFILNFWLETGLLGLLAIALLIYISLRQYRRSPNIVSLAAAIYLLVMLVHGMVDAPYFKNDLAILFWFMLSIFFIEEPKKSPVMNS